MIFWSLDRVTNFAQIIVTFPPRLNTQFFAYNIKEVRLYFIEIATDQGRRRRIFPPYLKYKKT